MFKFIFNDSSMLVFHFVSSPREMDKRDIIASKQEERKI